MKVEYEEPVARAVPAEREGTERFRHAFEAAPQAIWICDAAGRILAINPAYTATFGYDLADASTLLGLLERLYPDSAYRAQIHDAWLNSLEEYRRTKQPGVPITTRMRCRDGSERVCEIRCGLAGNGEAIAILNDITDRVRAEGRMRLWNSVLDHSGEGIMICDAEGRIVLVNAAFERMTGYTEPEVVGKMPRLLQSGRHDAAFYAAMWTSILETGQWHGELWNRRKNGEIYPEWLSINAVPDAMGESKHYVGMFSDISDRKAAEDRIAHLAQYDALTDLPNRALLTDRLAQLVRGQARDRVKAAVLFVDLDHFKEVNDSMGHEAGDLLLVAVAKRLRGCLRAGDTVARMGGDEFVIVLLHVLQPEDVALVAQKILLAIKQPVLVGEQELVISASVGICIAPDDGTSAGQLIRNADAAMYRAKSSGRDAYRFYTPDMNERALERLSLESALRRGITRGELVLHYQPQIDLRSGAITGAEALMRWNRPDVGLLPPGQFLPLAEERGLIVPMGEWAIEEGARQAAAWDRAGIPITVAVNLSALQFHKKSFVEHVAGTLAATRLSPERLELELTESMMIRDVNGTITSLQRLHELGVVLSIDDFGTGYSSLNYLRRFPIDRIKIDKSFVDEVAHHVQTTRVIRAILALAKGFELEVVAEGVETEDQLATLCREGCDLAQGYLFARPMPVDAFEAVFRTWRPRPYEPVVPEAACVEREGIA
jgi:diguanylate cyclase (GGDEF)-like protein/PAS domain S-box-containing protein